MSTTRHQQSLYVYSPAVDESEIRLLALLPAKFDDEVKCTLSHVSLDDEPAFEALSYTWGSPARTHSLICDGKSLPITKNLYEGLRRLRRRRAVRVIWADAVCINQDDVEERNQQILYMTRIYRQAKQVVVWLGEENDGQDLVDPNRLKGLEHKFWRKDAWNIQVSQKRVRQLPRSWLLHFNRPWFLRVWIIQEIAFARKITVIHGRSKIPWQDFQRIAGDYGIREPNSNDKQIEDNPVLSKAIEIVATLGSFQENYSTEDAEPEHPLMLALESGSSKATDLRDKVYALRGLFAKEFQEQVIPDYAAPLTDVLVSAANALVLADKNLDILKRATPAIRRPGLPSWVPDINESEDQWGASEAEIELWSDWRFYEDEDAHEQGYRSIGFQDDGMPPMRLEDERTLLVQGFEISKISYLSDEYVNDAKTNGKHEKVLSCVFGWYSTVRQHETFKSDDLNRLSNFCSACFSQLREPLWASTSTRKRAHGWSAWAFQLKYYCFRSNLEFMSDHSESEEKRRKMSTRAARAIRGVARFQADPQAALHDLPVKLKSAQILQKKDQYPIVPAGSDAESVSVDGNISSSASSAASITPPESASDTWSSASDSSDLFTKRWWKKAKPVMKKRVQKPARNWARFARKEYTRGREASKKQPDIKGDETAEVAGVEDHAASDAEPESDGEQGPETVGDSEDFASHSKDEAAAVLATDDIDQEPKGPEDVPTEELPSIRPLLVRQQSDSTPCTCTANDIDYLHHLTSGEDARVFDPADSAMTHKGATRFFNDDIGLEDFEQVRGKKFGWIDLPRVGAERPLARDIKGEEKGGVALGMFPIGARRGDIVVLVRGLRFPCVLRESAAGRYEWVGPCYVDRLWDWEYLELKAENGGAGPENLTKFSLV